MINGSSDITKLSVLIADNVTPAETHNTHKKQSLIILFMVKITPNKKNHTSTQSNIMPFWAS